MQLIGCIGTYNDLDLLPGAVKSLAALDRIVIVDGAIGEDAKEAASTDGTVDFLTKLAVEDSRVTFIAAEKPWTDKIAKRNACLVGQEGDWYLVLEPFERAYGFSEAKWFLPKIATDVFAIQQFPQPWAQEPVLVQRLFKHLPGVHYEGSPDRVVCDEKVLVNPEASVQLLTDSDPLIAPRIVSVMHKRLKGQRTSLIP